MKRLFFANIVSVVESGKLINKLDCEHEIAVEDDWDGDIKSYIRKRDSKTIADKSYREEYVKIYKEYPLTTSLDRNGIISDEELFFEFDDGDLWSMTLYYMRDDA